MQEAFYYNTKVEWKEERVGTLSSPTLDSFNVATPPDFPKGVPNTWSPEHLFVASVNVCLMTTFAAVAENSKLQVETYSCEATGKLEKVDGKFMMSEIELKPEIKIMFEKDSDRAERIIRKSENLCLISNSVKTKIILKPTIAS